MTKFKYIHRMEIKDKLTYEAPRTEVVEVQIESALLQLSGGKYPPYDGEKI